MQTFLLENEMSACQTKERIETYEKDNFNGNGITHAYSTSLQLWQCGKK